MIQQLSKRDKEWRKFALKICKDKTLADDLVQDMYLKMNGRNIVFETKQKENSYVFFVLNSLFINHIKQQNKTQSTILETAVAQKEGVNDYEKIILERFNKIPWHQQELIKETYTKSIRVVANEFNINYKFIHDACQKGVKTILGNDFEKRYNNTRNKRK